MITVNNQFEGGAIEVISAENAQQIKLQIPTDNVASTRQWFYFSVTTDTPTRQRIQLINADQVSFAKAWQDYQVFASYDGKGWFRVPSAFHAKQLTITHDAQAKRVFYAYFVPYLLKRHQQLLADVSQLPYVNVAPLTTTRLANTIDLITVGKPSKEKKNVWLIARQHPGETMAQWISEGFLTELCFNQAENLLDDFTFYIVANMNPDGSIIGNHRTNANGKNLNRCWHDACQDSCPEVFYLQKAMQHYGVDFFFDIHGDESIPHNFIMSKSGDVFGEQLKYVLAELEKNFQMQYDYDTEKSTCGSSCCNSDCQQSKTATGFVTEQFGATSFLLEASFKNLQSEGAEPSWDHSGCQRLGMNLLLSFKDTVAMTHTEI